MPNRGGGVLAHVDLVTITYQDDPHETTLAAFGDWVVASTWWRAVGGEYGVGPGTHHHVRLAQNAPAHVADADIPQFLAARIADGTLPSVAGHDYLYEIFYPPQTVVELALPCSTFSNMNSEAYHSSAGGAKPFAYAVVPSCSAETVSTIELGAAHELIEAATDPDPVVHPTYQFPSSSAWAGEVADLCNMPYSEAGFTAPTSWSNAAAAAGGDPCAPAQPGAFFDVSLAPAERTAAAGSSVTFTLQAWSSAPIDAWTVTAVAQPDGQAGFAPILALPATTVANGDTATLTASVPAGTASGSSGHIYLISSRGNEERYWPAMLTAQ
jgi:hypothetical protein